MGVGAKMKEVLKQNGYKQADFAEEIDVNIGQLNMVLNEKRSASYEMLMKFIIRFSDIDLNWLFRETTSFELNEPEIVYQKQASAIKYIAEIDKNLKELKTFLSQQ